MRIAVLTRVLFPAMLLALGLAIGCGERAEPGTLVEETHIMELKGAERVDAEIEISLGKIRITGGSHDMLDADFVYNIENWKPVIDYSVRRGVGNLLIKQPERKSGEIGRGFRYEFDLRFGDEVPLDIAMNVGAGECRMDLSGLPVTSLDLAFGAGDVEIVTGGSRTLEDLDLEAGLGDILLDLTGDWDVDLDVWVKAGMGKVTVELPEDTGVRVEASKGIGHMSMTGLTDKGSYYVNDAYGDTESTLYIEVETGLGAIEIRVGDAEEEEGATI